MSSGNAMMFANGALFDLMLARYIAANPSAFSGSSPVPLPRFGIELEYSVGGGTPSIDLTPQAGGGSFAIHLPIVLKIYGVDDGQRSDDGTSVGVSVVITGTFALQGQVLQFAGLKAAGVDGLLETKVAALFNKDILPELMKGIERIPLPDLTKTLGVPVQVVDVQVLNGQVAVAAQVAGGTGQVEIPYLPPAFPAVTAALAGDVINTLAHAQFQPQTAKASDSDKGRFFGYDAEAEAGAGNPQTRIDGGQAQGTLDVWAWAKAGVEVGGVWLEPKLGVSSKVPPLGLRLVSSGSGANLDVKLYLAGAVRFDVGLPGEIETYADEILGVIGKLGERLTGMINQALDPISIHAFTLPQGVPGTNLTANLSFATQGFLGNSAYAVVHIA